MATQEMKVRILVRLSIKSRNPRQCPWTGTTAISNLGELVIKLTRLLQDDLRNIFFITDNFKQEAK